MNVPSPREPSRGDSRLPTVCYALTSNARTARLCPILLVMTGVPGIVLALVLPHIRLRRGGSMVVPAAVILPRPLDHAARAQCDTRHYLPGTMAWRLAARQAHQRVRYGVVK